jgi:hypothetical protein
LEKIVGPGLGLEIVSSVNGIPKGSRLAVSTNLLGSLISVCMRATGQTRYLTGSLDESERRIVAARAILGEWLGGSGGGWQDSGGVWPGIKIIEGCLTTPDDPEHGISRGTLLPRHRVLGPEIISPSVIQRLEDSLILVHGGMAQNVGPILEMVTEKYLLRSRLEWNARQESLALFDEITQVLCAGDIARLGQLTTEHFRGPLRTIIPWSTTLFTERLITQMEQEFGDDFWGFWMLGGMSGGGMGFIVAPTRRAEASARLAQIMLMEKQALQHSLPFAMDPVVYNFAINQNGTFGTLHTHQQALMPSSYYALTAARWLRADPRTLSESIRTELARLGEAAASLPAYQGSLHGLITHLLPTSQKNTTFISDLDESLARYGFDYTAHEHIRAELRLGHIGIARNRLAATTVIDNVSSTQITLASRDLTGEDRINGEASLRAGEVGIITLAAGAASRWTAGAGVVKALHPFCLFAGRHRSFIELHLAKTRAISQRYGSTPSHFITTSYLTHQPIQNRLVAEQNYGLTDHVHLSHGQRIGLRFVPMIRDLRAAWEDMPRQRLDEQQEKMRASVQKALICWAESTGEAADYRDNLALQCLHPVGHWFEVPSLLLNGQLNSVLKKHPQLRTFMLHNIDTVGAALDPAIIGWHHRTGRTLNFEVIQRRLEDRGGGLAQVHGHLRLIEGLALPKEEIEARLSYYNTMTTWIEIDPLLAAFQLSRADLDDASRVAEAVRAFSHKLPTYITLKDVKKRWGHGQEDIFPVAQFEKIWGDMSTLPEISTSYLAVPRARGQQLKEPAQLDGWVRDGSRDYVDALCAWS